MVACGAMSGHLNGTTKWVLAAVAVLTLGSSAVGGYMSLRERMVATETALPLMQRQLDRIEVTTHEILERLPK